MQRQILKKVQQKLALQTTKSFCIGQPHFDPTRHTVMTHNIHFLAYDELVPIGYFTLATQGTRQRSRKYLQQIQQVVVQYLGSQGVQVGQMDQPVQFDLHSQIGGLLGQLSSSIYVQENKYRYVQEQNKRLEYSKFMLLDLNKELINESTLNDFIQMYDQVLWECVYKSHQYSCGQIKGAPSHLEQYYQDTNVHYETGIPRLQREVPENNTWINRIMERLHSY